MRRFMTIAFATLFSLSTALPVFAESFSGAQKTEMEKIIHDYLMANPQIMRDMANKLDENDKAAQANARVAVLKENAKTIFHDGGDAVVGNEKGDVTVVEFFDYNCHYCKLSIKEMQTLIKSDKNVRVVMKEFPIFGEDSEYAAKAALASVKQGKYWDFHQAMFASSVRVTADVVDKIAGEQGIDVAKMKEDMKDPAILAQIAKTQALAQNLQLTGTPGFLIDEKVIPGYVPVAEMASSVEAVRVNGGCKVC